MVAGGAAANGQPLSKAFGLLACLAVLGVGWYSSSHLSGVVVNQRAETKKIVAAVGQKGRARQAAAVRGALAATQAPEREAPELVARGKKCASHYWFNTEATLEQCRAKVEADPRVRPFTLPRPFRTCMRFGGAGVMCDV